LDFQGAFSTFVFKSQKMDLESDDFYIKQALTEAQTAFERGEVPVGAVVVCVGRIIARAPNLTEMLTDVTIHAEMQAILPGN
jgi:tRNA(adenine34) deaminase